MSKSIMPISIKYQYYPIFNICRKHTNKVKWGSFVTIAIVAANKMCQILSNNHDDAC